MFIPKIRKKIAFLNITLEDEIFEVEGGRSRKFEACCGVPTSPKVAQNLF
jgi:hypothetical protein